jgi:hypothetical protein
VPIRVRINLWSGPRNVSTALMYSFGQRPDTRVVDEPLYGHYLRVSGADHPGAAQVMAAMETDGEAVVREVILGTPEPEDGPPGEEDRPVVFFKQMAHHLVELDHGFLAATTNVLLVRDPVEMLPSLVNQIPQPTLRDTGLAAQARLLAELRELGQEPPVLEAREVLRDPRSVLVELCRRLGLPFYEEMLAWPAGPRPYDGVWAPHWYHAVHRSTGFEPYRPKREPFPERLLPLLSECRPHYAALAAAAIPAAAPPF